MVLLSEGTLFFVPGHKPLMTDLIDLPGLLPSRAEAIRRLVEIGLRGLKR
jgi:hypothetical protein